MKNFEVDFSFSGQIQVHANDEAEALRSVQSLDPSRLIERIDLESLSIHGAHEIEIGGEG